MSICSHLALTCDSSGNSYVNKQVHNFCLHRPNMLFFFTFWRQPCRRTRLFTKKKKQKNRFPLSDFYFTFPVLFNRWTVTKIKTQIRIRNVTFKRRTRTEEGQVKSMTLWLCVAVCCYGSCMLFNLMHFVTPLMRERGRHSVYTADISFVSGSDHFRTWFEGLNLNKTSFMAALFAVDLHDWH